MIHQTDLLTYLSGLLQNDNFDTNLSDVSSLNKLNLLHECYIKGALTKERCNCINASPIKIHVLKKG